MLPRNSRRFLTDFRSKCRRLVFRLKQRGLHGDREKQRTYCYSFLLEPSVCPIFLKKLQEYEHLVSKGYLPSKNLLCTYINDFDTRN